MKLYVCWGTFQHPAGHACANAYEALTEAGYDPAVVKCRGLPIDLPLSLPLIETEGRREVKELTGQRWVPVLVTDQGDVVHDSKRIVRWAKENPVPKAATPGSSTAG